MNDLFHFLRDLISAEPEVIAAFILGILVAVGSLSYPIYWLLGMFHARKIQNLETDLNSAKDSQLKLRDQLVEVQQVQAEFKKKAKERKETIEVQEHKLEDLGKDLSKTRGNLVSLEQAVHKLATDKSVLQSQVKTLLGKNQRLYANAQGKLKSSIDQTTALRKQVNLLNEQLQLTEKLQGQLWEVPVDKTKVPPFRRLKKGGPVIIAVTNLKGGVGKTTLTANIAITYCRETGKRVLAMDLDFQASLTNLCMPTDVVGELQIGEGRLIDNLFKDLSSDFASLAFRNLSQTREPKLHLLAASGNLANVEEHARTRWLTNYARADLRCVLRSALHNPLFQDNFDVILIDCPPRWTTASINAIACCDYVLIPTQLDRLSSEAVPRLLAWLRDLRASSAELYGHFEILGIVGNRAYPREKLVAQERAVWDTLPEKCKKAWIVPVYSFGTIIKDKSEFRRAANSREFAAVHPELQPSFLQLIQEIDTRRSDHEGR